MSWSTSELRVRLAPLNQFKPSSKIFYWPFQGGTSFVDLLCFCSVLCLLCFVHVCLYVLCGHLLGKGWPLGSRLWCLLWVCHFPIGILGQVWYLIVSIPDLCTITYFRYALNWSMQPPFGALFVKLRFNKWRRYRGRQPAGPAGGGATLAVLEKCSMSCNDQLQRPGGISPLCFSSTRFIVELCLLIRQVLDPVSEYKIYQVITQLTVLQAPDL